MKIDVSELALRFARALDREDYDVVRALLAPSCCYDSPNGRIEGADEIVDSYRRAGKIARALFESHEFGSALLATTGATADVSFSDILAKGGWKHVYRFEQRLHFSAGALVSRIVHRELPEERERLREFCRTAGVALPDSWQ
jgi:SnoaL-like domain